MQRRRDFLRLLASATGGVLLSSCGSSSDGGSGNFGSGSNFIPNGYRFIPLLNTGQTLPGGATLDSLPGGVLINGAGQILFHGSANSKVGLYELTPDYPNLLLDSRNQSINLRKLLVPGDALADGEVVEAVGVAVSNANRSHAVIVRHNKSARSLYLEKQATGFKKVCGFRTPLPIAGGLRLGGTLGDVSLNEKDDLIFVDHFTREQQTAPGQGLFFLPGANIGADARLLSSTDDPLPDSSGFIKGFGLIDLNSKDSFLAHVFGAPLLPLDSVQPPAQGLLQGRTDSLSGHRLLASPPAFQTTPRGANLLVQGGSVYGARLSEYSDDVAHVVHKSSADLSLLINQQELLKIGDRSPGGSIVRGFSGPVLQPNGPLFGVVITEDGHELDFASPFGLRILLSRGDLIGSRSVNSIIFGMHPDQVNSLGQMAFVAEFMDGSSSIILGLPI
ncbi:hypothetical protein JST97_14525 [bacterium]|nr:hypothetical protein [bacterium]